MNDPHGKAVVSMRKRKYSVQVGGKSDSRFGDLPRVEVRREGGFGMSKLAGLGVLVGVGFALAHQWPEIQRYLKMRGM